MKEAFAVQKLLTFFQQKYWRILDINIWNFDEMLTNDIVSFEQPVLDQTATLEVKYAADSSYSALDKKG